MLLRVCIWVRRGLVVHVFRSRRHAGGVGRSLGMGLGIVWVYWSRGCSRRSVTGMLSLSAGLSSSAVIRSSMNSRIGPEVGLPLIRSAVALTLSLVGIEGLLIGACHGTP